MLHSSTITLDISDSRHSDILSTVFLFAPSLLLHFLHI